VEGIPEYLEKGWGENRWRRVARFRLGNEMREGKYWEGEERRSCRICGDRLELWEHVWEECRLWREGGGGTWQEACVRLLGGEGEGERWMREVEEERRRQEEGIGMWRVDERGEEERRRDEDGEGRAELQGGQSDWKMHD